MVEFLAARGRPFQQLGAAVDRDAFLVAGDEERDRALRACRRSRRDDRASPRPCRRSRPSCRPRRGRTARRRRCRRRTARATTPSDRPAAPRRCGRRTSGAARRCRCGRRGSRRRRCRARRTSSRCTVKPAPLSIVSRKLSAPPSAGVTDGQRSRSRAMATGSAEGLSCSGFIRPCGRCRQFVLSGRHAHRRNGRRGDRIGAVLIGADGAAQAAELDEGPDPIRRRPPRAPAQWHDLDRPRSSPINDAGRRPGSPGTR